ncbi:D-cysteine desulfhydrase [Sphingomonas guangdongensis]|uniref:D-cysteine desulfhydrase n=1 Tax=Sphingomonas guangdongensis TaxID=1141890 RepID=A0A285QIC5_9SPHN|nr:D-cysteine desulfhydrase family protein [Sphingomonas guangdongensis]SOB79822.1 D-cysteine desulfhydrase [Sphingomonas guangdongensis]
MPDPFVRFPRRTLLEGVTPIQRLTRLEQALGGRGVPAIFVKRDDLTGLGGGGNKLRKLEYLLGAALAAGCDTFITTGARQSNHARLSAAAAVRAGLACELVLTDRVPRDDEAYRRNGNVLLDDLLGATVHRLPATGDALSVAKQRVQALQAQGRQAYVVGAGGSSPTGCLGYANCAVEITRQEVELGLRFDQIVVPNGSSGTHAGLLAGMVASDDDPCRVCSYTVLAPLAEARADTRTLSREVLDLFGADHRVTDDDVVVGGDALGEGYGIPTKATIDTVRLVARTEGLLLDPVYGGKAMAGLLGDVRAGRWSGGHKLLFVMTGGLPGLFAYEPAFRT